MCDILWKKPSPPPIPELDNQKKRKLRNKLESHPHSTIKGCKLNVICEGQSPHL